MSVVRGKGCVSGVGRGVSVGWEGVCLWGRGRSVMAREGMEREGGDGVRER